MHGVTSGSKDRCSGSVMALPLPERWRAPLGGVFGCLAITASILCKMRELVFCIQRISRGLTNRLRGGAAKQRRPLEPPVRLVAAADILRQACLR
jgi:hypothetical protein